MKNAVFALACLFLFSCGAKSTQEKQKSTAEQITSAPSQTVSGTQNAQGSEALPSTPKEEHASEMVEENGDFMEYATYYVTIADTGQAYHPLRQKMMSLSKELSLKIDTMGRYYDAKKDIIVLPENDEDEMFAGDYYPRRDPEAHLSLEYLDLYQDKAKEKTIALVSGIYEQQSSADSALAILQKQAPSAFVVKTKMYIGCLH